MRIKVQIFFEGEKWKLVEENYEILNGWEDDDDVLNEHFSMQKLKKLLIKAKTTLDKDSICNIMLKCLPEES